MPNAATEAHSNDDLSPLLPERSLVTSVAAAWGHAFAWEAPHLIHTLGRFVIHPVQDVDGAWEQAQRAHRGNVQALVDAYRTFVTAIDPVLERLAAAVDARDDGVAAEIVLGPLSSAVDSIAELTERAWTLNNTLRTHDRVASSPAAPGDDFEEASNSRLDFL
jgi:hypothetical protein